MRKMAVSGHPDFAFCHWFLKLLLLGQSTLAQVPLEGGQHYWDAEMQFTDEDMEITDGVYFPRHLTCSKTQEIAYQEVLVEEPDNLLIETPYHPGLSYSKWSIHVEEFYFYNEQFEEDQEMVQFHGELDKERHYTVIRYGLLLFVLFVLTVHTLSLLFHVGVGTVLGRILLWSLPRLHPPIKNIGRSLILNFVLTIRSRIQYLNRAAYAEMYRDTVFQFPHFFRDHTSESEPSEIHNMIAPSERREGGYNSDVFAAYSSISLTKMDPKNLTASALYVREMRALRKQNAAKKKAFKVKLRVVDETKKKRRSKWKGSQHKASVSRRSILKSPAPSTPTVGRNNKTTLPEKVTPTPPRGNQIQRKPRSPTPSRGNQAKPKTRKQPQPKTPGWLEIP